MALKGGAKSGADGVQNAVQHIAEQSRSFGAEKQKAPDNSEAFRDCSVAFDFSQNYLVGVIGLEPMTPSVSSNT